MDDIRVLRDMRARTTVVVTVAFEVRDTEYASYFVGPKVYG